MESLIGHTIHSQSGPFETRALKDLDIVLLYFSAHWCPPCRTFTPKLKEFYNQVNSDSKKMEVIFISCDNTKEEYESYYSEMPWLSVPFEATTFRDALSQKYGVAGIPSLILIDKTGNMLKDNCRMDVTNKGPGVIEEWRGLMHG